MSPFQASCSGSRSYAASLAKLRRGFSAARFPMHGTASNTHCFHDMHLCLAGIVILLLTAPLCLAETTQSARKFSFGPTAPPAGFVQVLPTSVYTKAQGYGFEEGGKVAARLQRRFFTSRGLLHEQ